MRFLRFVLPCLIVFGLISCKRNTTFNKGCFSLDNRQTESCPDLISHLSRYNWNGSTGFIIKDHNTDRPVDSTGSIRVLSSKLLLQQEMFNPLVNTTGYITPAEKGIFYIGTYSAIYKIDFSKPSTDLLYDSIGVNYPHFNYATNYILCTKAGPQNKGILILDDTGGIIRDIKTTNLVRYAYWNSQSPYIGMISYHSGQYFFEALDWHTETVVHSHPLISTNYGNAMTWIDNETAILSFHDGVYSLNIATGSWKLLAQNCESKYYTSFDFHSRDSLVAILSSYKSNLLGSKYNYCSEVVFLPIN